MILVCVAFSQSKSGKYFVFLNNNPNHPEMPEKEVDAIQAKHMDYMDSLAKEMIVLASGPFHGAGSFQVLVASSLEDAQKIADSDPAIKANLLKSEVYPLEVNIGGICPVGDDYEMIEYQFIRYVPLKDKIAEESKKKIEKLTKRHVSYLKANFYKRRLIASGDFGSDNGGFLVAFKTDDIELDKFIKYDPMIRSELYDVDIRILWIAKGTFCVRMKN